MILVKGGLVVDPANGVERESDILIENDRISELRDPGGFPAVEGCTVVDASGKWVVPGLIDLHVHLREPGFEWKETIAAGSRAAVSGGYTSICCMPNTRPVNDSTSVTEFILDRSESAGLARVLPIGAVSIGSKGESLAPLSELWRAGCVAFSDDGEPIYDAGIMRKALEWCLIHDATITCHEEDKCLSCGGSMNESALSARLGLKGVPGVAEDVMVARDIELARFTGGKVHICHISTARGVELVRRAKNDGIRITCEVTPHHLVLTEEAVAEYDTHSKMSPPLRGMEDVEGLRKGLEDGTIDAIASDHAPHDADSKLVEFSEAAIGILGLQTSLPIVLDFYRSGKINRSRAIEVLTATPAKVFGLDAGTLSVGSPADVAIIDPGKKWVFAEDIIESVSKNSPFVGRELEGKATDVVVGGKLVVKNEEITG